MKPGDKVIFKPKTPFKIKSLYIFYSQLLKGNVYTISDIESFYDESIYCSFLELEGCRFPIKWFIPCKGLSALIERRNKCLK